MAAPEGSTTVPLKLAVVNCPIARLGNESIAAKTVRNAKKYDAPRDIGFISFSLVMVLDYIRRKREKASTLPLPLPFTCRDSWHSRRRAGARQCEGKRPAANGAGPH